MKQEVVWLLVSIIFSGSDEKQVRQGGKCGKKNSVLRNKKPPHIILILADDLGWNEVSWHNPSFKTPRMEELSADGVRLSNSYVTPKCSPSRAALMTGLYPWRLGLQRGAIERYQATGLNPNKVLLPELLQKGGYATHLVGKWHLGYCNQTYLPMNRGFQTFFGQYNHVTNYYTRRMEWQIKHPSGEPYDLHDGLDPSYEGKGMWITDLYTKKAVEKIQNHNSSTPLFLYLAFQAPHLMIQRPPDKYMSQYSGVRSVYQRGLPRQHEPIHKAAAVTALDTGVGKVVDALKAAGLYDNSVIVFTTDNGGNGNGASNFPLRAGKESLYEGGIRGVGWVHSPLLCRRGLTSKRMMFITDWFSTLLSVAGLESLVPPNLDSFNVWSSISKNSGSPRKEIILNLDQDNFWGLWSGAIRSTRFKLIWGQQLLLKQRMADKACALELYNLQRDPEEKHNLLAEQPDARRPLVAELKTRLMQVFPEMAEADYPREIFVTRAVQNGSLSTGWCEG